MSHKNDDGRKHDIVADMADALARHLSGDKEHPLIASFLETMQSFAPLASALAVAGDRAQELLSLAASEAATLEDFFGLEPIDGFTVLQIIVKSDATVTKKAKAMLAGALSAQGKNGAKVRHRVDYEKRDALREIWAQGSFTTKRACAEEECEALGMSLYTAIKALTGAPDPDPWPAKRIALKRKAIK